MKDFKPLYNHIVVEPYVGDEKKDDNGLILSKELKDAINKENSHFGMGTIVAVGSGSRNRQTGTIQPLDPLLTIGAKILYNPFAHITVLRVKVVDDTGVTEKPLLLVTDTDVLGVVDEFENV